VRRPDRPGCLPRTDRCGDAVVLVLEDVHVHYGSAHVLYGVGLEVQGGSDCVPGGT